MNTTHTFTKEPPAALVLVGNQRIRCIHAHREPTSGQYSNACCDECRLNGGVQVVGNSNGAWFWLTEVQVCATFPFMFSTERQVELLQTAENAQLIREQIQTIKDGK